MSDEAIEVYDNPALAVEVWSNPAGDWWHAAGVAHTLLTTQGFTLRRRAVKDSEHEGVVIACGPPDAPIFTIQIMSIDGKTNVIANTDPDYANVVRDVRDMIDFVDAATATADSMRRFVRPTADEVIEMYYRSRAAGGKVTLRALARRYDFNVTYLSQVKRQYDQSGKWGAKTLDTHKAKT